MNESLKIHDSQTRGISVSPIQLMKHNHSLYFSFQWMKNLFCEKYSSHEIVLAAENETNDLITTKAFKMPCPGLL